VQEQAMAAMVKTARGGQWTARAVINVLERDRPFGASVAGRVKPAE
jgi:hypothetical protein